MYASPLGSKRKLRHYFKNVRFPAKNIILPGYSYVMRLAGSHKEPAHHIPNNASVF